VPAKIRNMRPLTSTNQRSECVISNVLDIFGDKWTFLIIRDLFLFNKHEFKEFLSSPESIATTTLTDRLKRLLAEGIIAEQIHPENASRKLYYLTQKGKDLLPIMVEMARWGSKHMPELNSMQELYAALAADPEALRRDVLGNIENWEKTFLSKS
jgi:DNA-binding HxlR family transcriptional regulator